MVCVVWICGVWVVLSLVHPWLANVYANSLHDFLVYVVTLYKAVLCLVQCVWWTIARIKNLYG